MSRTDAVTEEVHMADVRKLKEAIDKLPPEQAKAVRGNLNRVHEAAVQIVPLDPVWVPEIMMMGREPQLKDAVNALEAALNGVDIEVKEEVLKAIGRDLINSIDLAPRMW